MTVMEAKKTLSIKSQEQENASKAADFVGDVKVEIGKIHWTSKEELKTYTQIVVISTFALGMGIYFADLFIQGVLAGLSSIVRLLVG